MTKEEILIELKKKKVNLPIVEKYIKDTMEALNNVATVKDWTTEELKEINELAYDIRSEMLTVMRLLMFGK